MIHSWGLHNGASASRIILLEDSSRITTFTGVEPERVRILPARGDVNISGRAVYFPANSGAAGTELQIWEVDADTGERLGDSSLANFNIGTDGRWGPVRLDPKRTMDSCSCARPGPIITSTASR